MSWIFPWVPKRLLSRLTGLIMRMPLPLGLRSILVRAFARGFHIRVAEAEKAPQDYRTFDEFFTRRLKQGARPLSGDRVHPVDGVLTTRGTVHNGELIQAKGWPYTLAEFIGSDPAPFEGGTFLTYYLCPADYHRVHAPLSGLLHYARHIPGLLWPVNAWSVQNVRRLFNLNERVVLNFTGSQGPWTLVLVGATNVGKISIAADPSMSTNRWLWHAPTDRTYMPPIPVGAGDEVGTFHLGSTVICLFARDYNVSPKGFEHAVRMGEQLI